MNALTPNINFDIIQDLPVEVAQKIFSYLDPCELGKCCAVNNYWRTIATDERLWKNLFPGLNTPPNKSIREHICESAITSKSALVKNIIPFIQRIKLNQIAEFNCYFPFNPNYNASVVLGYGNLHPTSEPEIKEQRVFVGQTPQDPIDFDTPASSLSYFDPPYGLVIKVYNTTFKIFFGAGSSITKQIVFRYSSQEATENTQVYHQIAHAWETRLNQLREMAVKQRELKMCCVFVGIVLEIAVLISLFSR